MTLLLDQAIGYGIDALTFLCECGLWWIFMDAINNSVYIHLGFREPPR